MISRIIDKVVDEMNSWQSRPLDRVYPVVLIDAIYEVERTCTAPPPGAKRIQPLAHAAAVGESGAP